MAKVAQEFENAASKVSVSVQKSPIGENSFIGRVSRNTVNIDNLINSICEKVPTYDRYACKRFIKDLKAEVIANLSQGKSVNLFDLGTLYLALSGAMKGVPKSASDIASLTVKYSASKEVLDCVQNVEIDKIVLSDSSPAISAVECKWKDVEAKTMLAGKIMRITGAKLKLEGEESGVFVAPILESGEASDDEATWLKTPMVLTNLPKTLEVYAPDEVEDGKQYAVVVKTRPNAAGVYAVGFSEPVTAKKA